MKDIPYERQVLNTVKDFSRQIFLFFDLENNFFLFSTTFFLNRKLKIGQSKNTVKPCHSFTLFCLSHTREMKICMKLIFVFDLNQDIFKQILSIFLV